MGTLFGFAVGYIIGARAGSDEFDDVVRAFKDLRESAEWRGLVDAVVHHARETARTVSERLAGEDGESIIDRARNRLQGAVGSPPPPPPVS